MCLNQILHGEQIAMMRAGASRSLADRIRHRHDLSRFGEQLKSHPYPHRPYAPLAALPLTEGTR